MREAKQLFCLECSCCEAIRAEADRQSIQHHWYRFFFREPPSFLHFFSSEGRLLSLLSYILTRHQSKHAKITTQASYQNLGGYMWNDSKNDTILGYRFAIQLSFCIGCKWVQPGAKLVRWVHRRASVLLNLAINACNSHFLSKESKESIFPARQSSINRRKFVRFRVRVPEVPLSA